MWFLSPKERKWKEKSVVMKLKKEMMSSNWTLFLVMYKQMEISTRNVFVSQEINQNLIIDLGVISIRWELKQEIE